MKAVDHYLVRFYFLGEYCAVYFDDEQQAIDYAQRVADELSVSYNSIVVEYYFTPEFVAQTNCQSMTGYALNLLIPASL